MMIYYNLFTKSDQSLFSLVVAMSVSVCLSVKQNAIIFYTCICQSKVS